MSTEENNVTLPVSDSHQTSTIPSDVPNPDDENVVFTRRLALATKVPESRRIENLSSDDLLNMKSFAQALPQLHGDYIAEMDTSFMSPRDAFLDLVTPGDAMLMPSTYTTDLIHRRGPRPESS